VHANWLKCIYVCVMLMLNWTWTKLLQVVALFLVHHLHFQRWFNSETLNPRLFTGFLYRNKRQCNWCYHVHHLYNTPWAPSSFVHKFSQSRLNFNSIHLYWYGEMNKTYNSSNVKTKDPYPCFNNFRKPMESGECIQLSHSKIFCHWQWTKLLRICMNRWQ